MEDLIIKDEEARKLLNKASKITTADYKDYSIKSCICAIEDLLSEIDYLKDEMQDMAQDIRDNYKPVSKAEQVGFSERDFL